MFHEELPSRAFAALGDPVRCEIVSRLSDGEATVAEVTDWFEVSQPAVSRHLKILEDSGWIERRRVGKTRPCRLNARALDSIDAYLGKLRQALESNYDQLDALLAKRNRKQKANRNE